MAALLRALLSVVKVAVISGGNWQQFEKQLLANLPRDERLKNLSLLPTCGTKFFKYNGGWERLYSEDFTGEQKEKIISSLRQAIGISDCLTARRVGASLIEDRGSQIHALRAGATGARRKKKKMGSGFREANADESASGYPDPGVFGPAWVA